METKAKKFSHKLLALFMAIVMGLTCFSGVITALGADSTQARYDEAIEYNDLAWNILSDEQVATALLDLADSYLPALRELEPQIANMVNSNKDISSLISWDLSNRQVNILGQKVDVRLGSIDELLHTLNSAQDLLDGPLIGAANAFGISLGIITSVNLRSVDGMSRSNTSSCDIIRGILGIIYNNNDLIVGNLLRGSLSLGVIPLNIYSMLGGMLGVDEAAAKDDFVYNIVKSLLFNYTEWFSDAEKEAYTANPSSFVYDDVLLEKMTVELLDKISVYVTYADGTTSGTRRVAIEQKMSATGMNYKDAAESLNYDGDLIYSKEKGMENNILLFAYGNPDKDGHATADTDMIQLTKSDNIADFGYQALKMGWSTVLKDTAKLVHVNYDVDRGHGSNFDNAYFYWASENIDGGWDVSNPAAMYSAANVEAWAEAVYESYDATSAEEFLSWVQYNLDHERTASEESTGSWKDIESNKIFNKLRYSPLVDYYFANTEEYAGMKTGPINLYLSQLGTPNLDEFFKNEFASYNSLVAGFNNCLIAIVKDLFPDSANIGNTSRPDMTPTAKFTTIDDAAVKSIARTLVGNALNLVQYVADAADENILKAFYTKNGTSAKLTEDNLEAAIVPLFISCIGNVNLGNRLDEMIHPEDWDRCTDLESIAFLCLREYLSYILPDKDYNVLAEIKTDSNGNEYFVATLEGTILPMARDAVVYVMDGYVPVTDKNGNEWRVEDKPVNDSATLLELLNSVICYYADNYQFKAADKKDGNALGIASLFAVCDTNGKSLVKNSNTIWQNVDLIANKLLPVLGVFQGTGKGNFNSEELIWNDIVLGMLDFGGKHTSGLNGGSNFIYRILKFITASPIQSDPIINVVYDFVYDFINALFGPRYAGQGEAPFPARKSEHPFDDLLHKGTLSPAVIGWLQNFIEFAGYASKTVGKDYGFYDKGKYPDTLIPGLMFAVTSVNSFFPLVPSIAENTFKLSSVTFKDNIFTGCSTGVDKTSSVTFTNECYGLNLAYVDGMENTVKQLPRYFVKIKSATLTGPSTALAIDNPDTNKFIAPGESVTLNTHSYYAKADDTDGCVNTVTITYDVYASNAADAQPIHTNLKARDYQYMSIAKGWSDVIYSRSGNGIYWFPQNGETETANQTINVDGSGLYTKSTARFSSVKSGTTTTVLIANYPESVVLGTDNLSAVNDYGILVKNIRTGGTSNRSRTLESMYYFDNATVYDDNTKTNVTVGSANPIPVFDKATGNLLLIGTYDYSTDGGNTWNNGKTEAEVDAAREAFIKDANNEGKFDQFVTRTHIAYTLQQAVDNGIIAAYHQNERGEIEYMYLKTNGNYSFITLFDTVSMRGPVDGFYVNHPKIADIPARSGTYGRFLTYDGSTNVPATNVTANIAFYSDNGDTTTGQFKFIVADTSSTNTISAKLTEIKNVLNNYRDADLTGDTLDRAVTAITDAFGASATPLTPDSAVALTDKTARQFITATSASETGDRAYQPITDINQIPESMRDSIYLNSANGIYYADKDFVSPLYSNAPLTSARGEDPAGLKVTAVDGVFRHVNTPAYEQGWNLGYATPYYGDTTKRATNENGDELFNQIQFKHYNANGKEVRDADDWTVAIPQSSERLIANTDLNTDNRGIYTRANDSLDYTMEYVKEHVKADIAQPLLTNVSIVRNNLESVNFDVVTYNKMVDLAKKVESEYSIEITYDSQEPVTDDDGKYIYDDKGQLVTQTVTKTDTIPFSRYNSYMNNDSINITEAVAVSSLSSAQVDEYLRLFNNYIMPNVVERGYLGDQLEAEIVCASGNDYKLMTVVETANGVAVKKAAGAADPAHGAWAADGTLVNEGTTVYSDETWNAYVAALANAISIAQHGHSAEYSAYATRNYYQVDQKENYTAQVSNCYNADTALQKAEIALDVPSAAEDGYNVSASLVIATDINGATKNTPVHGDYTVTVYGADGNVVAAETFAMSKANNTFSFNLLPGTYTAKIESAYALTREDITINVGTSDITGPAIPIIACDFNGDGGIAPNDVVLIYSNVLSSDNQAFDLNGDNGVAPNDAVIVYSCIGTPNLEAVAIG
ncbi:MAG: hypothetical protein K2L19_09630 [Eubacterium sp.]|nr:hypothetical protein [Eubacterium sp.]